MINCSLYLPKPHTFHATRTMQRFRQIDYQQFAADLATEMSTILHKDHTDADELLADLCRGSGPLCAINHKFFHY